MHMGYYLIVWWDFRNGAVPVVFPFCHFSREISRKPRPNARLSKGVDETTVRERFYHINSPAVDPDDKRKSGNPLWKFLERIGILFENNIGWEGFLYEYIVEHIRVIVENGDGFLGKCFRHFTNNPPPGSYRKIAELFHSDEEAYSRSLYPLIVIIKCSNIFVYEVPKCPIKPKRFFYDFHIAFDQIHMGIVDIRMREGYVENVRSPEDIGSGDYGIVEFFVSKNCRKISASHIEKE